MSKPVAVLEYTPKLDRCRCPDDSGSCDFCMYGECDHSDRDAYCCLICGEELEHPFGEYEGPGGMER